MFSSRPSGKCKSMDVIDYSTALQPSIYLATIPAPPAERHSGVHKLISRSPVPSSPSSSRGLPTTAASYPQKSPTSPFLPLRRWSAKHKLLSARSLNLNGIRLLYRTLHLRLPISQLHTNILAIIYIPCMQRHGTLLTVSCRNSNDIY